MKGTDFTSEKDEEARVSGKDTDKGEWLLCLNDGKGVGKIDAASILRGAISVGSSDDVDGVFVSCTNIRAVSVIPEAEKVLKKPVTASNHALAWHLLRLAGVRDTNPHAGRLFQAQLA